VATKPVLILAPGLLCDAALWRHQSAHLGDVAEVKVADFTHQTTMAAMAASVLALTEGSFALAGFSMGGYVALEVMRQAPERVARLALLGTSARADAPEHSARRRGMIELAEKGDFKGVTARILPLFLPEERLEDEPLVAAVMEMTRRVGKDAFLRQQAAIMGRADSRPDLGAIAAPTLVACGRQDTLTPLALSQEIAAGIPNSTLVPIEACGHMSTMERPEAVTALLRYWLQR
jgi:pimeloyl-ACP methyl ester carboxylesterase